MKKGNGNAMEWWTWNGMESNGVQGIEVRCNEIHEKTGHEMTWKEVMKEWMHEWMKKWHDMEWNEIDWYDRVWNDVKCYAMK